MVVRQGISLFLVIVSLAVSTFAVVHRTPPQLKYFTKPYQTSTPAPYHNAKPYCPYRQTGHHYKMPGYFNLEPVSRANKAPLPFRRRTTTTSTTTTTTEPPYQETTTEQSETILAYYLQKSFPSAETYGLSYQSATAPTHEASAVQYSYRVPAVKYYSAYSTPQYEEAQQPYYSSKDETPEYAGEPYDEQQSYASEYPVYEPFDYEKPYQNIEKPMYDTDVSQYEQKGHYPLEPYPPEDAYNPSAY